MEHNQSTEHEMPKSRLFHWFDERFPLCKLWRDHLSEYYAPKNFNMWYFFGSLALLLTATQFLSGIWLAMFYVPTPEHAFASVEYIMRDVHLGWLLRYVHSTGASAFFIVIYLHMFRALLYGSYKNPREMLWLVGVVLYVILMAEAFMGYLLPWGQMSYWAAQVITSLFSAIPGIGDGLAMWVRGDYNVSGATLGRFFALHVAGIPLLFIGLVWLHITSLHHVGSNNPDGVEIHDNVDEQGVPRDGIPFHPYYTSKDLLGYGIFMVLFLGIVFFAPEMGGYFLEHANFTPADPLKTPLYIAPVWYMTPFYAMLRAIPDKLVGVIVMGAAIVILFFLPWLDRCPVKSIRYRGVSYKIALTLFTLSFVMLSYLGTVHVTPVAAWLARIGTVIYFGFFLLMPLYTRYESTAPVPTRVTMK